MNGMLVYVLLRTLERFEKRVEIHSVTSEVAGSSPVGSAINRSGCFSFEAQPLFLSRTILSPFC